MTVPLPVKIKKSGYVIHLSIALIPAIVYCRKFILMSARALLSTKLYVISTVVSTRWAHNLKITWNQRWFDVFFDIICMRERMHARMDT